MKKMKNIAIISPNQNAYSETFIQAHKNYLKGNIHFLYGNLVPHYFGNNQSILQFYIDAKWQEYKRNNNIFKRILKILPYFIYQKKFSKYLFDKSKFNISDAVKFYFTKNNINIVLAEYGLTGAEVLPICQELKIPLIVHFHGYDASEEKILSTYKDKYENMFEYAKFVIVVSNVMKNKILELGCPPSKIILNTYGPNNIFLELEPKFTKQQFIAIGRFVNKKAPYYTIFAFEKVIQKYQNCKLILAGEGELLNTCKNLVKMLNFEKNIIFAGVITPLEFKNYLLESIAFVQHSIIADNGDSEGTPVAVLEASAAGLPVISTNHAGIPDVIIHGETGLLVEEHDVDGMAENMLKLLDNIELAKKLGVAGKQRIKDHFTMEKHISVIQNLINS